MPAGEAAVREERREREDCYAFAMDGSNEGERRVRGRLPGTLAEVRLERRKSDDLGHALRRGYRRRLHPGLESGFGAGGEQGVIVKYIRSAWSKAIRLVGTID